MVLTTVCLQSSKADFDWVSPSPRFHVPVTTCCGVWKTHRWLTPKSVAEILTERLTAEQNFGPAGTEGGSCRATEEMMYEFWEPKPSFWNAKQVAPDKNITPLGWCSRWINCAICMTSWCSLNVLITAHPNNSFFPLPHEGGKYPSDFFRWCDKLANCC